MTHPATFMAAHCLFTNDLTATRASTHGPSLTNAEPLLPAAVSDRRASGETLGPILTDALLHSGEPSVHGPVTTLCSLLSRDACIHYTRSACVIPSGHCAGAIDRWNASTLGIYSAGATVALSQVETPRAKERSKEARTRGSLPHIIWPDSTSDR